MAVGVALAFAFPVALSFRADRRGICCCACPLFSLCALSIKVLVLGFCFGFWFSLSRCLLPITCCLLPVLIFLCAPLRLLWLEGFAFGVAFDLLRVSVVDFSRSSG
jgi:hypothetical protein